MTAKSYIILLSYRSKNPKSTSWHWTGLASTWPPPSGTLYDGRGPTCPRATGSCPRPPATGRLGWLGQFCREARWAAWGISSPEDFQRHVQRRIRPRRGTAAGIARPFSGMLTRADQRVWRMKRYFRESSLFRSGLFSPTFLDFDYESEYRSNMSQIFSG